MYKVASIIEFNSTFSAIERSWFALVSIYVSKMELLGGFLSFLAAIHLYNSPWSYYIWGLAAAIYTLLFGELNFLFHNIYIYIMYLYRCVNPIPFKYFI